MFASDLACEMFEYSTYITALEQIDLSDDKEKNR